MVLERNEGEEGSKDMDPEPRRPHFTLLLMKEREHERIVKKYPSDMGEINPKMKIIVEITVKENGRKRKM